MKKNIAIIGLVLLILYLLFLLNRRNPSEYANSFSKFRTFIDKNFPEFKSDEDLYYEKFNRDIQKSLEFDRFKAGIISSPPFRSIDKDSASCFCNLFQERRRELQTVNDPKVAKYHLNEDETEAVLLSMDTLLTAITLHYPDIDFQDTSTWHNKSILVYLANYGKNGYGIGKPNTPQFKTVNHFKSSVVIQFVKDTSPETPDEWQPVNEKAIYNFGDLKPPKIISENHIGGSIPSTINCIW